MKSVPFSIAGLKGEAWRSSFEWPVAYPAMREELLHPTRTLLAEVRQHEGYVRDVMVLGLSRLPNIARALLEVIKTFEMAESAGICLTAADEVRQWLDGEADALLVGRYGAAPEVSVPKWAAVRRMVRIMTWSPLYRILQSALFPEAVMITHNHLAVSQARKSAGGIGMVHADSLLAGARQGRAVERRGDWSEAAERVARLLVVGSTCSARSQSLAIRELTRLARQSLEWADSDLQSLARVRLPRRIWSGTAGAWSSRAIGIAVMQQGGKAIRFDHGGSVCLVDDPDFLEQSELSASNEFVCTTQAIAEICQDSILPAASRASCRISSGEGDPSFAVPLGRAVRRRRPNVIYATTVFRGLRQYHFALLPDPVYLDWQLRVLEMLSQQDVRILFKPHPEGLLKILANHPAAADHPIASKPFESYIDEADIFLFDYAHTTTFWKALCTGKPVILLDLGNNALNPRMRALLEQCNVQVIRVSYNDAALPFISEASLTDALQNAGDVDCRPFRSMFAGENPG